MVVRRGAGLPRELRAAVHFTVEAEVELGGLDAAVGRLTAGPRSAWERAGPGSGTMGVPAPLPPCAVCACAAEEVGAAPLAVAPDASGARVPVCGARCAAVARTVHLAAAGHGLDVAPPSVVVRLAPPTGGARFPPPLWCTRAAASCARGSSAAGGRVAACWRATTRVLPVAKFAHSVCAVAVSLGLSVVVVSLVTIALLSTGLHIGRGIMGAFRIPGFLTHDPYALGVGMYVLFFLADVFLVGAYAVANAVAAGARQAAAGTLALAAQTNAAWADGRSPIATLRLPEAGYAGAAAAAVSPLDAAIGLLPPAPTAPVATRARAACRRWLVRTSLWAALPVWRFATHTAFVLGNVYSVPTAMSWARGRAMAAAAVAIILALPLLMGAFWGLTVDPVGSVEAAAGALRSAQGAVGTRLPVSVLPLLAGVPPPSPLVTGSGGGSGAATLLASTVPCGVQLLTVGALSGMHTMFSWSNSHVTVPYAALLLPTNVTELAAAAAAGSGWVGGDGGGAGMYASRGLLSPAAGADGHGSLATTLLLLLRLLRQPEDGCTMTPAVGAPELVGEVLSTSPVGSLFAAWSVGALLLYAACEAAIRGCFGSRARNFMDMLEWKIMAVYTSRLWSSTLAPALARGGRALALDAVLVLAVLVAGAAAAWATVRDHLPVFLTVRHAGMAAGDVAASLLLLHDAPGAGLVAVRLARIRWWTLATAAVLSATVVVATGVQVIAAGRVGYRTLTAAAGAWHDALRASRYQTGRRLLDIPAAERDYWRTRNAPQRAGRRAAAPPPAAE